MDHFVDDYRNQLRRAKTSADDILRELEAYHSSMAREYAFEILQSLTDGTLH